MKALDEESAARKAFYVLVNQTDRAAGLSELPKKAMCEFQPHEIEYMKVDSSM